MPEEPPNINSTGDQPTGFWEEPDPPDGGPRQGRGSHKPKPGGASHSPGSFRIPDSDGDLDTLAPGLAAEHRAVELEPGDVVADRFEVVERLGFGGMGAVYHVRDRITKQSRALKVMLSSLLDSEGAQERFVSEVTISQQLAHEGVVRVYDIGEDPARGIRFFTMELVEGMTLNHLLKERGGKLPLDEALNIVRQLCDALEYAHRYTVHRDLKPQNIMIRPDGSVKVLDFGLAKIMSPGRMTRSSMALGTAYYQAPEQGINLKEIDHRADIYSIGVILYQMLTGKLPVGRLKAPSELDSSISSVYDDIVLKCIEPESADRYTSVSELWAAFERTPILGENRQQPDEARIHWGAVDKEEENKKRSTSSGVSGDDRTARSSADDTVDSPTQSSEEASRLERVTPNNTDYENSTGDSGLVNERNKEQESEGVRAESEYASGSNRHISLFSGRRSLFATICLAIFAVTAVATTILARGEYRKRIQQLQIAAGEGSVCQIAHIYFGVSFCLVCVGAWVMARSPFPSEPSVAHP